MEPITRRLSASKLEVSLAFEDRVLHQESFQGLRGPHSFQRPRRCPHHLSTSLAGRQLVKSFSCFDDLTLIGACCKMEIQTCDECDN